MSTLQYRLADGQEMGRTRLWLTDPKALASLQEKGAAQIPIPKELLGAPRLIVRDGVVEEFVENASLRDFSESYPFEKIVKLLKTPEGVDELVAEAAKVTLTQDDHKRIDVLEQEKAAKKPKG